jgi:hypothetical protein
MKTLRFVLLIVAALSTLECATDIYMAVLHIPPLHNTNLSMAAQDFSIAVLCFVIWLHERRRAK